MNAFFLHQKIDCYYVSHWLFFTCSNSKCRRAFKTLPTKSQGSFILNLLLYKKSRKREEWFTSIFLNLWRHFWKILGDLGFKVLFSKKTFAFPNRHFTERMFQELHLYCKITVLCGTENLSNEILWSPSPGCCWMICVDPCRVSIKEKQPAGRLVTKQVSSSNYCHEEVIL